MKKMFLVSTIALIMAVLCFAQNGTPSSKATAAINTAVGCTVAGTSNIGDTVPMNCHDMFKGTAVPVDPVDNFATVMQSTIKVSNSQSLFVSPSFVTGLYTQTKTQTKTPAEGSATSTAQAMGGVYARAKITNQASGVVQYAYPVKACETEEIFGCYTDQSGAKGVILDSRIQTLSQTLSNCITSDLTGTVNGSCDFTSTIDLILETASAHTFNFIFPSVGQGVYTVEIQAAVGAKGTIIAGSGTAIGAAAFGLGSLTVESVRLVHDFSF